MTRERIYVFQAPDGAMAVVVAASEQEARHRAHEALEAGWGLLAMWAVSDVDAAVVLRTSISFVLKPV